MAHPRLEAGSLGGDLGGEAVAAAVHVLLEAADLAHAAVAHLGSLVVVLDRHVQRLRPHRPQPCHYWHDSRVQISSKQRRGGYTLREQQTAGKQLFRQLQATHGTRIAALCRVACTKAAPSLWP